MPAQYPQRQDRVRLSHFAEHFPDDIERPPMPGGYPGEYHQESRDGERGRPIRS